jgi:8-oxo-dGTP pyrophosphatase MutT (NUDIX family)
MINLLYKIYNRVRRTIQKTFGFATLGVRAIVINQQNEILLVQHSYESGWFLPGGGVDKNEPISVAIRRELMEEAGVSVNGDVKLFGCYVHKMLGSADYPFVFVIKEFTQIASKSREIKELGWFNYNSLPEKISPGSKRRLHEYFNNSAPSEKW